MSAMPLFRGATRPPMIWGVPFSAFGLALLLPLTASMLLSFLIGMYALVLMIIPVILIPLMRQMSKQDDQILRIAGLDWRERIIWLAKNRVGDVYGVPPQSYRDIKHMEQ